MQNLQDCGARDVCAFRAGDFAANSDTLSALARNGIMYDTSYNACYLDGLCEIRTPELLLQPRRFGRVYEFPVGFFNDLPGHNRHTQLTACSNAELENALIQARRRRWYSLVLVSHSFELIRRRWRVKRPASPDRLVIRRFERLCRFLADNSNRFRTVTFSELDPDAIPTITDSQPLQSNLCRTVRRSVEQLVRRIS